MKRQLNRNRLMVHQWYFGGGNRISVFTRRPKMPFKDIRNLYLKTYITLETDQPEIASAELKYKIRKQIRKENINARIRSGIILLVTLGIMAGMILFIKYLILFFKSYN